MTSSAYGTCGTRRRRSRRGLESGHTEAIRSLSAPSKKKERETPMPANSPLAVRVKANVAAKSGTKVYEGQPIEASVRSFRDQHTYTSARHHKDGIDISIHKVAAGNPSHSNEHYASVLITYKGLEVIFDEVVGRLGGNRAEIKRLANLLLKIRDNCIRKL